MAVTQNPTPGGNHGYFRNNFEIAAGGRRVEITLTYSNPVAPTREDLMRVDFSYEEAKGFRPVSMEFYPDGRLYGVATWQGQRPAVEQEKDALIQRIESLVSEMEGQFHDTYYLLKSFLEQAKTLPLLEAGKGR